MPSDILPRVVDTVRDVAGEENITRHRPDGQLEQDGDDYRPTDGE